MGSTDTRQAARAGGQPLVTVQPSPQVVGLVVGSAAGLVADIPVAIRLRTAEVEHRTRRRIPLHMENLWQTNSFVAGQSFTYLSARGDNFR